MTWEEFQDYVKGKVILVGLNFVRETDEAEQIEVVDEYETFGTIQELTEEALIVIKRKDGSIFQIPYDGDAMAMAEEGIYTLEKTGDEVENPDFILEWNIQEDDEAEIEKTKQHGFIPE